MPTHTCMHTQTHTLTSHASCACIDLLFPHLPDDCFVSLVSERRERDDADHSPASGTLTSCRSLMVKNLLLLLRSSFLILSLSQSPLFFLLYPSFRAACVFVILLYKWGRVSCSKCIESLLYNVTLREANTFGHLIGLLELDLSTQTYTDTGKQPANC